MPPIAMLIARLVVSAVAAGALACLAACGGPQLDRLEGDPPSTHRFTTPLAARTHPAVDGCQRFVSAVVANEVDAAWLQLSSETRKALQQRAIAAGARGIDLLRLRRMPVGDSMQGAVPFDPLALFAVPNIQTLQLVPGPADDKAIDQRLRVVGEGERERDVTMRFEGYAWRIHHPSLKSPDPDRQPADLPSAATGATP